MNEILVSVVVISYNSGDTILDTLNSIYQQTYSNIELIVSDDDSTDNCVELANVWAQEHGARFTRCIIHKNAVNLGVPGNLNAGIDLSAGIYIKVLAADDLLLPDCIAQNVACCEEYGYDNLSSRVYPFRVQNGIKVYDKEIPMDLPFFAKSAEEQFRDEIQVNRVVSPTLFLKRELLDHIGMFDPQYRFLDDYPMYIKMLQHGHKLNFLDAYTVEYRLSDNSLSNTASRRVVHPGYHQTIKKFFFQVRLRGLIQQGCYIHVLREIRRFFFNDIIILLGNNRELRIVRFFEALRDRTWRKRKEK